MLDTSFIFSYVSLDDRHHNDASNVMKRIESGEFGKPFVSDFIFDEILTLAMIRKEFSKGLDTSLLTLLNRNSLGFIRVNDEVFRNAVELFFKYEKLSFTDCTSVAILNYLKEKYIASFESNFDGINGIVRIS